MQRRCALGIAPDPTNDRPYGLYGVDFARASEAQILAATRPVSPPTLSNILALAAPSCGRGFYTAEEIWHILRTCYSGFQAAARESSRRHAPPVKTVIHTGFWGCGAFGGNRTLMTMLQALAADLAEVEVVFWAFDQPGVETASQAHRDYTLLRAKFSSTEEIVGEITRRRFPWGVSDGN